MPNFDYGLTISEDGHIRIEVVTKDPAVALLINQCIAKLAEGTLETMDREVAEAETEA